MEYLTVKEIGERWGVTARMINYYCSTGRISGAIKKEIYGLFLKMLKSQLIGEQNQVNTGVIFLV